MSLEKLIESIHELGYLIHNVSQGHPTWRVTVRSPYAWDLYHGQGKTFTEATTNVLKTLQVIGPARPRYKPRKRRVTLPVAPDKPKKQRVKRAKRRVRLKSQ